MAKALTDYNSGEKSTNPNLQYAVEVSQKHDEHQKKLRECRRDYFFITTQRPPSVVISHSPSRWLDRT